jgi:hypothetical protein
MSDTTFCRVYDQERDVELQDRLVYDKKKSNEVIGKYEGSKKGN